MDLFFFFFQAEDGIRDYKVTGVQTCALPISLTIPNTFIILNTAIKAKVLRIILPHLWRIWLTRSHMKDQCITFWVIKAFLLLCSQLSLCYRAGQHGGHSVVPINQFLFPYSLTKKIDHFP